MAEEAGPRKHAGSCLATLRPDSNTDFGMSDSLLGGPFEFVSYQEVDINQRAEFEALLKKVGASNGIWLLLASRFTHNVQLPPRNSVGLLSHVGCYCDHPLCSSFIAGIFGHMESLCATSSFPHTYIHV